jgi:hypothetical protein
MPSLRPSIHSEARDFGTLESAGDEGLDAGGVDLQIGGGLAEGVVEGGLLEVLVTLTFCLRVGREVFSLADCYGIVGGDTDDVSFGFLEFFLV